jgi:hypothetical protein
MLAAVAAFVLAATPPAAAATCPRSGDVVLARSAAATIVADRDDQAWGCFPGGRRVDLNSSDVDAAETARIAGPWAGIQGSEEEEPPTWFIHVVDLRRRIVYPAAQFSFRPTWVLTDKGSLAFIAPASEHGPDAVWRCLRRCIRTRDGRARRLGVGDGIDPRFLRARDGRVFWRDSGKVRSAPLP